MSNPLIPGTVALIDFSSTVGREQSGLRPAVVISSADFSKVIDRLVIVVPCTRVDRGWRNHIQLSGQTGLTSPTFAMTEQPRTVSVERVIRVTGRIDQPSMNAITRWVHTWVTTAA